MGQHANLFEKIIANVRQGASNSRTNVYRNTPKEVVRSLRSNHAQQHDVHRPTDEEHEPAAPSHQPSPHIEGNAAENPGQCATREGLHAAENSHLVIGRGVKLVGEISNCETLVVDGDVEAKNDSRMLKIASNGSFKGTVNVDVAEIYGRFEGELVARQKLIVYATGSVTGQISYGKLVVEEGGRVSGSVTVAPPAAGAEMAVQHLL
ncbi:bactofilin family protein [Noviherbaspirillum saxi]|uniref:Polymer-forming cytoskeletal protein n=1 Tax=Noviherbaspirillum saxi TaxID=2320863 RepID=A0A3A3FI98_9BURK|nr:polymer-forming cytoskeletal protein [Noviherbaspirillum saxi]RJF92118.1 polymer-forming cytoskeletal protein [Noviherbaspirillum saxi]